MEKYIDLRAKKGDKKLMKFLAETKREFNTFFNHKINEPLLFFLNSRQDMDLIAQRKTENWFVGLTRNNGIFILDKKVYARESNHPAKDFWVTLKHEYAHVYYLQIIKSHYPFWLNEGLACYLSGKKLDAKNISNDKLLKIFSYFNSQDRDIYPVGHWWVDFLVKKYGTKKIIRLLKSLKMKSQISNRKFSNQFFEIYGFKFNKENFAKFIR